MKTRRDGERAFAIDFARFWLAENGKVVILLLGLTCFTIVAGLFLSRKYAVHGVDELAEVVRFGARSDYDGDHLLVVVRTRDGRLRTLAAGLGDIFYCHPGSQIRLVRRGEVLAISGPSCIRGN